MEHESVTFWISQLSQQDAKAAERLWDHFSARMQNLARQRLDPHTRRTYDEQDAANSAFHSLCRGISDGRFEQIADRDSMWALLAVITARKVSTQQRFEHRQKRGGGDVRGNSVFLEHGVNGFDVVESSEPTPEFTAIVTETCDRLIESLDDPMLKQIAMLKFEGYKNAEVGEKLGRTRRTIERKLEVIRRIWVDAGVVLPETPEEPETVGEMDQSLSAEHSEPKSDLSGDLSEDFPGKESELGRR